MAYRVRLEGSSEEQWFDFPNYDDALSFVSMAVDHGMYQDYHWDKDELGDSIKIWDDPKPIEVRMVGVKE